MFIFEKPLIKKQADALQHLINFTLREIGIVPELHIQEVLMSKSRAPNGSHVSTV